MEPQKLEALAPKGSLVEDYWDAQRAAMTHLDSDVHLRSLVLYTAHAAKRGHLCLFSARHCNSITVSCLYLWVFWTHFIVSGYFISVH